MHEQLMSDLASGEASVRGQFSGNLVAHRPSQLY